MKYKMLLLILITGSISSYAQNKHPDKKQEKKPYCRIEYRPTNKVVNQFDTIFEVVLVVDESEIENVDKIKVKGKTEWGQNEKYHHEISKEQLQAALSHKKGKTKKGPATT